MKTLNKKTLEFLTGNLIDALKIDPSSVHAETRNYIDHTLDCIISGADGEQALYVMRNLIERIAELAPKKLEPEEGSEDDQ
ncbi:hypothetical protein D8682_08740 [Buttiauxella sp. 3AFRM03]|uniref:hypothetical protein n=1 Tax=Buttiauxella sp. 3AFRM03 TaxID=2479367 RepID=UPI000EF7DDDB|nr:hypothetical protein [Buttiauxella sp. 3AFRM03]AYN27064.1 hypothetical protein D8682_08740 [Buttiauxella sp. 3AFRM03]